MVCGVRCMEGGARIVEGKATVPLGAGEEHRCRGSTDAGGGARGFRFESSGARVKQREPYGRSRDAQNEPNQRNESTSEARGDAHLHLRRQDTRRQRAAVQAVVGWGARVRP